MFLRRLLNSRAMLTTLSTSTNSFFKSRNYLKGKELADFREQWSKYSPREKMQIAINQSKPACGDVLISQGDFHKMEGDLNLAIQCYKEAVKLNNDCGPEAEEKIIAINNLKKTDVDRVFEHNLKVHI